LTRFEGRGGHFDERAGRALIELALFGFIEEGIHGGGGAEEHFIGNGFGCVLDEGRIEEGLMSESPDRGTTNAKLFSDGAGAMPCLQERMHGERRGRRGWRGHEEGIYTSERTLSNHFRQRLTQVFQYSITIVMHAYILPQLACLRCQHTWIPRKPEKPMVCPDCKSPYWDIPRKEAITHVDQAG